MTSRKEAFFIASKKVLGMRSNWYQRIANDSAFRSRGGIVYPYDTIAANIEPLFIALERSGIIAEFEQGTLKTVCDMGCANGELSYSFALTGHQVTAVDYSYKGDQAPLVVSLVTQELQLPIAVVDRTVDCNFQLQSLRDCIVGGDASSFPKDGIFDLIVCFGLLYHLKNPFAFLESLSHIGKYIILGTHVFTHLPSLRVKLAGDSVAYLVHSSELNSDPTNYWIFTETALHRMISRCGFEIVSSFTVPNNQLEIGVPDRIDLGVRAFVMLRSKSAAS